jgi:hypothetical protein
MISTIMAVITPPAMAATRRAGRRDDIADMGDEGMGDEAMGDTDMGEAIGVDDPMSLRSRVGMWQYRNGRVDAAGDNVAAWGRFRAGNR